MDKAKDKFLLNGILLNKDIYSRKIIFENYLSSLKSIE